MNNSSQDANSREKLFYWLSHHGLIPKIRGDRPSKVLISC